MKMKKVLYIFLLFTQIFWAQNAFEKGNELYRQEKFEEAVQSYESILKTKKESVELYYNLGNAYYKLNKVAPAIYNYEKALLLNPDNVEVKNNLKFAQNMTIDEIKVIPEVGFKKLIHDFTSLVHYDTWGRITIGLGFGFLLCFIGYYFSRISLSKRLFFVGMILLLGCLVVSITTAIFEKNQYNKDQPAIIFQERVAVKNEPNEKATDAITIHEGAKVQIIETIDNWSKIELQDNTVGWVMNDSFKKLK